MVCSINQLETKQRTYIYHITLKSTKKERKEKKAIVMQLSSNGQAIVKQLSTTRSYKVKKSILQFPEHLLHKILYFIP